MAVNLEGQVAVLIGLEHVKPGKGPAYIQAKMRNIFTGGTTEKRLRSGEEIEQAILDRREMEYLYSDGSGAVFMDNQNYDQMTIHADVLGDAMLYLKPNTMITVLVYDGKVVNLELPASVDLQITETAPGIKGATATNQLKEAICETGLKTRVPPFIKNGEVIRISTSTGEYLSRAGGE
jgi:elongation factor P